MQGWFKITSYARLPNSFNTSCSSACCRSIRDHLYNPVLRGRDVGFLEQAGHLSNQGSLVSNERSYCYMSHMVEKNLLKQVTLTAHLYMQQYTGMRSNTLECIYTHICISYRYANMLCVHIGIDHNTLMGYCVKD